MGNVMQRGPDLDAVVVGAGFAGLYMLHALRKAGFKARVFDAAPEVGGTWYWNRYPGCRCDIESVQYSFQFDEALQQEWTWSERYAGQPELLAYIKHVADRFDLRKDITLETRVESAQFDAENNQWSITTTGADTRETVTARHLILGVGCLSTIEMPEFPDAQLFQGEVIHTARWPQVDIDLAGQRVGVIGTGSSGIQSIPLIAEQAEHLYVFQRTPNYVVPAQNRPIQPDEAASIKETYGELRAAAWKSLSAFEFERNPGSVFDMDEADRVANFEKYWGIGGLPFFGSFGDLLTNKAANEVVIEWWKGKVREIVDDPHVAELLIPKADIFGGKRLCAGTNYFETYNRDNVTLVDLSALGIERFTETGVAAAGQEYELDTIVCATGFDAMTGSVVRMDITGLDGKKIADKWAEGPHNYLGLGVAGFPNLFNMQGPGSPSVFATMVTGIEHQGDWITDCLTHMVNEQYTRIDPTPEAEAAWVERVAQVAKPSLRSTCDSWYIGSNIDGKPRVFMPWIGGFPAYVESCDEVAENNYRGFVLS
ncbi:MAG: cyclohexanone monooxygenase [Acidimicrobiales bacterium]|jgi:cyclohexanone monooxygenase